MLLNIIIDLLITIIIILVIYRYNIQNIRLFQMIKKITEPHFVHFETNDIKNLCCGNCNSLVPKIDNAYDYHLIDILGIILCKKCYISEHTK